MTAGSALASDATGDLYYTKYTGGQNIWKVSFNYDDAGGTATLGTPVNLASAPGADGIIFAPNGNLLVGGQGARRVFEYTPGGTLVGSGTSGGFDSYHLAMDPSGSKVWTSAFGGPAVDLALGPIANGTAHAVTGSDSGITQLAFAPASKGGKTFYVNGQPNGNGNLGVIDMNTFVTTRFATGVDPAHGMVYDEFTGLMTLFGDGEVGSFDPASATPATTLKTAVPTALIGDFDQGAVDGKGHALVAGSNAITFIDYSTSGDITAPDYVQVFFSSNGINFGGIDDVAPLSGLGSSQQNSVADGGSTLALLLLGGGFIGFSRRARR